VSDAAIVLDRCLDCGAVTYFRRDFCPVCGSIRLDVFPGSGRGIVEAVTEVHRAPSKALQALAPYRLCLVRVVEGVRVMAHADPGVEVGSPVILGREAFADQTVPYARIDGAGTRGPI
jgi:uncharacterized OB-fold protein